jgi:hypothetical protein
VAARLHCARPALIARHHLQRLYRLHTSAYVSIRQHTSANVSMSRVITCSASIACIRQHTPTYASIRQHTSAYVSMSCVITCSASIAWRRAFCVSICTFVPVKQGHLKPHALLASVFVLCTIKARTSKAQTLCLR